MVQYRTAYSKRIYDVLRNSVGKFETM